MIFIKFFESMIFQAGFKHAMYITLFAFLMKEFYGLIENQFGSSIQGGN